MLGRLCYMTAIAFGVTCYKISQSCRNLKPTLYLLPSLVIVEHMFLQVFGFLSTGWHSTVLGTELSRCSSLVNMHLLAPQWKFQMPCLFLVLLFHLQDDYSLLRHVLDPTGHTARGLYCFVSLVLRFLPELGRRSLNC